MMVKSILKLHTVEAVKSHLTPLLANKLTIGFVPTMGALHEGHISLVKKAQKECDVVIVSIFVNPTQFNNANDLKTYPRKEEKDLELLKKNNCDFVFLPSVEEIYPKNYKNPEVNLGFLAETMEGEFRPGHFDGVVSVVSRLFDIVQPTKAYFGEKDFQQVAVIRKMTNTLKYPIEIISVETMRESSGLAMSSRNLRLNEVDKENALIIFQTLNKGKNWVKNHSPQEVLAKMLDYFSTGNLEIEYLKIVHPDTLEEINNEWISGATACIVAYCNDVRLLDNIRLVD